MTDEVEFSGEQTRTVFVAAMFVHNAPPIRDHRGRQIVPDRLEIRYEQIDYGQPQYVAATVSGMQVDEKGRAMSAAGSVTFSDNGPNWVNTRVIKYMPKIIVSEG